MPETLTVELRNNGQNAENQACFRYFLSLRFLGTENRVVLPSAQYRKPQKLLADIYIFVRLKQRLTLS